MNPAAMLHKLSTSLRKLEDATLVTLLLFTILFAVSQILLRNLFHTSIPWGDNLLRIAVLWLGLIGAMIASRERRHIKIDILSRFLPPRRRLQLHRLTHLVTALICIIVTWYSIGFVWMEYEQGYRLFDVLPVWITEVIIPFAFGLMGLRYLLFVLQPAPTGTAE
jgi:TRAP-type C4-dicarboxylate transport system permease small subunit